MPSRRRMMTHEIGSTATGQPGATDRATPDSVLCAADSFRVRVSPREGVAQVRAYSRHLARFSAAVTSAVEERGGDPEILASLPGFLADASRAIALGGEGFPRFELWDRAHRTGTVDLPSSTTGWPRTGRFAYGLALRPLPPLTETVQLRSAPGVRLSQARRKGPNIARLTALGAELGAEGLLVSDDGQVLEGSSTSLLWWEGETLCRVARDWRVPSIVEELVSEAASTCGYAVRKSTATPAELREREVWVVNALHGLRVVTAIDGVSLPAANPERLTLFVSALDATWEAVRTPTNPVGARLGGTDDETLVPRQGAVFRPSSDP